MTTPGEPYPWTRRENETSPAYEAFRVYLDVRSTGKVAEQVGKSVALMERWCHQHNWVDRVRAYDNYMAKASTDGLVHELTAARSKNLQLVEKLREHLSNRLDTFITKNVDPTPQWNQALRAMAELEKTSFAMKEDAKSQEQVKELEELIEELAQARVKALTGDK